MSESESKSRSVPLIGVAALFGVFTVVIGGMLIGGVYLLRSTAQSSIPKPSDIVNPETLQDLGGTIIDTLDKEQDAAALVLLKQIDAIPMPPEEEVKIGRMVWNANKIDELPQASAAMQARVENAFRKLLKVEGKRYKFEGLPTVKVIDSPSVNAATFPGGHFLVSSGLVDAIGDDEEQLLFVLGHELGHSYWHMTRVAKIFKYQSTSGQALPQIAMGQLLNLAQQTVSQENEHEADDFACEALYKLDIDTDAGVRVMRTLHGAPETPEPTEPSTRPSTEGSIAEALQRSLDKHLRSHPGMMKRIERIKKWKPR